MIAQGILSLLAPELALVIGAIVVLLVGVARSESLRSLVGLLSFLVVLVALALALAEGPQEEVITTLGIQVTNLGWYIRVVALGVGLIVLLVNGCLPAENERGELYAMILFSLCGVLLTGVADDLVLLFLAIELVSVPTYILVSIGRSQIQAQEAGVKYFFLGALAAALMVYGFSFLYGATGSTAMTGVTLDPRGGYATLGLVLAFAGLAFKITAVPFHAYAADVYQGAASPVSGLLGFFPKIAGLVALMKLLLMVQPTATDAVGWELPGVAFWFLWLVAAATMTVGNVLALIQTNVKRILAYSSVAHSGYMLIGILVGPVVIGGPFRHGLAATLFYIVVYGVMNLGAFGVLALLRSNGRAAETLDDLAGLARRVPMAALVMAICLFSLMGMPPTAGFVGKVYLFIAALSVGSAHPHQLALIVLAVIGMINAAIAAAYYLRVIAACYLGEPVTEISVIPRSRPLQIGLVCCTVVIFLVGMWPRELIRMARQPFYDVPPAEMARHEAVGER
jgi:NADH-quinone oxidoreductase subunit N